MTWYSDPKSFYQRLTRVAVPMLDIVSAVRISSNLHSQHKREKPGFSHDNEIHIILVIIKIYFSKLFYYPKNLDLLRAGHKGKAFHI